MIDDLLEEVSCERQDKKSKYLEDLIEAILVDGADYIDEVETKFHCEISVSKEKHNALQYTYYYTISSELIPIDLYLEVEDGINNGTQLNDYSFTSTLEPKSRTVNIIVDIILDDTQYVEGSFFKRKSQAILDRDKSKIFDFIKKNNYDNYVTGGHSKMDITKELWSKLHLDYVYDEIEVDIHLV